MSSVLAKSWFSALFVLLCFTALSGVADNYKVSSANIVSTVEADSIPLKVYLSQIEKKFEVFFNYDEKLVIGKKVLPAGFKKLNNDNWKQTLGSILEQQEIELKKLNNTTYALQATPDSNLQLKKDRAADQVLEGFIFDENGDGLPGATVLVKGTSRGTVTAANGFFTLEVEPEDQELIISFIGYLTQEVPIGSTKKFEVVMSEDRQAMEEVVVIGYGTQKKKDLSSAIATIEPKELSKLPTTSVQQALQGQAAGVMVSSFGGTPGATAKVQIRGVGTMNSTDPLYVIDGIPGANVSSISPSDIASMQILKDAASTAIYGARGANGVIIITTKSGKSDEIQVSFDAFWGMQDVHRKIDLLNATQYAELMVEAADNASSEFIIVNPPSRVLNVLENPTLYGEGTNWQDAIFQTSPMSRYNVNVSGGKGDFNYSSSLGYFKNVGTMINTDFEQYLARIKSQLILGKLTVGQSLSIAYSERNTNVSQGGRSLLQLATTSTPSLSVRDSAGNFQGATVADGINIWNPVAWSAFNTNRRNSLDAVGGIFGQYEIIEGLNLKANFGITSEAERSIRVIDTYNIGDFFENTEKDYSEGYLINARLIQEYTLNYEKFIGDHTITGLVGYTREKRLKTEMQVSVQGFASDRIQESVGSGQELLGVRGTPSERRIQSLLARLTYDYKSKYYFTANLRRDGSSTFDPQNQYGNFSSASVAWRFTEESFMNSLSSIVNNAKLRFSLGEVGNAIGESYPWQTTLNSGVNYTFGKELALGTVLTNYPTVGARWETTFTYDIGLDVDLFDNKLVFVADYFIKQTRDILLQVPIPMSASNHKSPPYLNAGEVENRGIELSLSYNNKVGALEYGISGNFTHIDNEVKATSVNDNVIVGGDTELGNVTRFEVGYPIGYFLGYQVDGIYRTQAEIDAVAAVNPNLVKGSKPGDLIYRDQDENGLLNGDDMVNIGSPIPDFMYGLNANLAYRGVDMSVLVQGVYGNEIFSEMIHWTQNMSLTGNQSTEVLNRWLSTPENASPSEVAQIEQHNAQATLPRAELDRTANQRQSDRYIEDGSYLRLRNVTLGYTLPDPWTSRIGMKRMRVYVQGQNLLTLTNYSMFDPEITSSDNLGVGIDRGVYPVPRVFLMGLNINF